VAVLPHLFEYYVHIMPASCEIRGTVAILSVRGHADREDLQQALGQAIVGTQRPADLRLLWDARQSQTALTAEDFAWCFDLVNMLAARGVVSRLALLLHVEHRAMIELTSLQVMREALAVPSLAFTDEQAACAWLESPDDAGRG